MKRIISIALLYSILGVPLGIAQEPSQEFNSLDDYYVVTEMYKFNELTKEVVEYERDSIKTFLMLRKENIEGPVEHYVFSIVGDDHFAVSIGYEIECDVIETDTSWAKKTICYEGHHLRSEDFDEKDGYLFVYEELKLTPEFEEKGYNVVSFSYYFLPNSVLKVIGAKYKSNYDPDYVEDFENYSSIKLIEIGNYFYTKEMYSLAIFYLSKAIKKDSTAATNRRHGKLASAKLFINNYEGTIVECNKAIELEPNDNSAYFMRAFARYNLHDYSGAIADFTKVIELEPNDNEAYFIRGIAKDDLKNYRGAIDDYTKAIELEPNDYKAYVYRGTAKRNLHDYSGAIADFTKVIELKPYSSDAYYNRGLAKDKIGDYRGAIDDYTKAIELEPDYSNAYFGRGVSKVNLEDHRGAIIDFTKVIELEPNNPDAYYNRGLAKIELGQKDSGCLDLSKAGEFGLSLAYDAIREFCN